MLQAQALQVLPVLQAQRRTGRQPQAHLRMQAAVPRLQPLVVKVPLRLAIAPAQAWVADNLVPTASGPADSAPVALVVLPVVSVASMAVSPPPQNRWNSSAACAAAGGQGGGGFGGQRPPGGFGGMNAGGGGGGGAARAPQQRRGTVMVKLADGKLEPRQVVIGVTNRVHGQVLEGLKEGEEVVIGLSEPVAAPGSAVQTPNANQNQNRPNNFQGGGFPGGGGNFRPF